MSVLLAIAALCSTASFANTKEVKPVTKNAINRKMPFTTSCTVTVAFKKTNVTITNSCTCTQTEACDGAYKIARLATMFNK